MIKIAAENRTRDRTNEGGAVSRPSTVDWLSFTMSKDLH